MCGIKSKVSLLGLAVCLLLQPLSLFSVELTDEEWQTVKETHQDLKRITNERDSLQKDKETLIRNNEKLLNDNEKLLIKNENLEKENESLIKSNTELLTDLDRSLNRSRRENILTVFKWSAITFALTSLGWGVYHYYDKSK